MSGPGRRNFAHLSAPEQAAYVNAVRRLDLHTYVDGVSWWDKQDQIHQAHTITADRRSSRGTESCATATRSWGLLHVRLTVVVTDPAAWSGA